MKQITFEIVTPEGLALEAEVYEAILPTPEGYIAVLPHHIPLISLISPGVISIRHRADDPDTALEHLASAGGFVEVGHHRIRLLTDSAERAEDIDELKVKAALEQAQKLRQGATDDVSLADTVAIIEQNTARLKVAELRRRRQKRMSS